MINSCEYYIVNYRIYHFLWDHKLFMAQNMLFTPALFPRIKKKLRLLFLLDQLIEYIKNRLLLYYSGIICAQLEYLWIYFQTLNDKIFLCVLNKQNDDSELRIKKTRPCDYSHIHEKFMKFCIGKMVSDMFKTAKVDLFWKENKYNQNWFLPNLFSKDISWSDLYEKLFLLLTTL